jgi:hypothetical protein
VEVPIRWLNLLLVNNAYSKKLNWVLNHNSMEEIFDNGTDDGLWRYQAKEITDGRSNMGYGVSCC